LDKMAGWNWIGVIHPEDVDGIVSQMASLPRDWGNLRVRNSRPPSKWRISLDVPSESATSRCKREHRQVAWIESGY
jgi:hypothetical protein